MADFVTIYRESLQNTRTLEEQGLQQMKSQLSGNHLNDYPRYASVLKQHCASTESQINRLDHALGDLDSSRSGLKEAVGKVAGAIGTAVHSAASDTVLKNLYAGYAFQYDQIAAYRSLIVIAKAAGFEGHEAGFRTTIEEEKEAASRLDEIIEVVTSKYLDLAAMRAAS